ncbi:MAG: PQQ-binding-like beta-propeller repeat protein, partial [Planctomycetaceae bacterium]|nr:PQQ-binding-like beta-propeller repeat protein [Planctomycetaceae bacterium]
LLQSSKGVAAVDVTSGETKWEYLDGASTIPSLTIQNEIAYVPSHGLTAIRPGISDPKTPRIVWQASQLAPASASPVVFGDRVYVVNRAGVVSCASLEAGKRIWQARLTGPFSSTPIISAGRMYSVNERGLAEIMNLGVEQGEVISSHDFKDVFLATPAASNGAFYIRSDQHLWKIK